MDNRGTGEVQYRIGSLRHARILLWESDSFCGKVTADDRTKLETLSSLIGNTIAEFAALACRRIEFAVKIIIMIALQSNNTE